MMQLQCNVNTSDSDGLRDTLRAMLFQECIRTKKTLYSAYRITGCDIDSILFSLKENSNTKLLFSNIFSHYRGMNGMEHFIYSPDNNNGYLNIQKENDKCLWNIYSFDKKTVDTFIEIVDTLGSVSKSGKVYIVSQECGGLDLRTLGRIHSNLERQNYTEKVQAQYDNVCQDLTVDIPMGRITLINGDPGTGKSFLLKGIISEVDALFIYIPGNLASEITAPNLLPLLMSARRDNKPIVLIMEDADASLAVRQLDNVSRLSDLLNISDGLLGEMVDLRIIATTNCKKEDIDRAVLRHGRLNEYIELRPLTPEHATKVFCHLIRNIPDGQSHHYGFTQKTVLADVYQAARIHGWQPQKRVMNDCEDY